MISFQDGPKPRNYLSRREQRRLLLLVLALGLVVILMFEAGNPKNWQLFVDLDDNPNGDNAPKGVGFLPADKENTDEGPDPALPRGLFPGVDEKLLKAITDNTRFRDEENAALFNILGVLRRTDESDLQRASIGRVSWLQLNEQSHEYRGELVTVRGTIRRAHRLDATKNDEGIDGYYRIWLWPDDKPDRPIVVYCLELPQAFPTGMELSERGRVSGFYFKRWLYLGKEDLQTAPVLLAKTVSWQENPPAENNVPAAFGSIYFLIAAAAVLSLLAIGYILFCTRGRSRKEERRPVDLDFDIKLNREEESQQEQEK